MNEIMFRTSFQWWQPVADTVSEQEFEYYVDNWLIEDTPVEYAE